MRRREVKWPVAAFMKKRSKSNEKHCHKEVLPSQKLQKIAIILAYTEQ